ncbi:MAG: NADH-quinone oxidoreductase subunit L [Dehalococcoidales bacterium]|nr:NADH-quinone oxidoreductase subunit L [Dehalococcoidales bacterium]
MQNQFIWLIFLTPLLSFLVISFLLKPFFKNQPKLAGYVTITAVSVSLILSLVTLIKVLGAPHHEITAPDFNWIIIEGAARIHFGLKVDALTSVMLLAVNTVSLMVQIYSQGYMHGDPGYHRYYAVMSLFTTAMLGLVLADSLLLMFIFWELVGLCSYLLIGFWFHRPAAANAAKKAFLVTRLGDLGFLLAIIYLFANGGTFNLNELFQMAVAGALGGTVLTWAALGILSGAIGKSAQFPLHVWLPDAMEGPTPVSALIHAATMAAAGVFLVARTYPLFEHSTTALQVVAVVGGVTAIFAASIGLVQNDIKRVLAYSTISQLGYMMLGLATGGVAVGIFHLFNHAFFKALLFLGAGSVNHATKTFDMNLMGGLRKAMPWTYRTFLIGSLSLAGIWPLSGFWSKDEIVAIALEQQPLLGTLAMITVFMTAFYMFRVIFKTFGGSYRGEEHLHESTSNMVIPMVILAVLAVTSGWFNITGGFSSFFGHGESHGFLQGLFGIFAHPLPWISLLLAGAGILLAYAMYSASWVSAEAMGKRFAPLYQLFYHKYWIDELYENLIVRKVLLNGLFALSHFIDSKIIDGGVNTLLVQRYIVRDFFKYLSTFDRRVVDGLVDLSGKITLVTGSVTRKVLTGKLQFYGLFIGLGMAALIMGFFIFSPR